MMASAAAAQEQTQRIILHGFGEWAYARTDGNEYLDGSEQGDYDTVGLGLNVTSQVSDNISVVGQFAVRSRASDNPGAELDYAFAEWRLSDAVQVRFGRSKHPFGIYTEIFDIGTLRPFFHLPLSIYGPAEIAAQSYDGIGLTGRHDFKGSTSVDYDLYGGEVSFASNQRVGASNQNATEQVRNVFGGRARLHTAIDGLSVGASAYTGKLEHEGTSSSARHLGLGMHAEYAMAPLTLRAEVGEHSESGEGHTRAFYLEGAYRIREKWEIATRYDQFKVRSDDPNGESPSHRDIALGLNYWQNANFVLKLSLHNVRGLAAVIPANEANPDNRTTALIFGSQFTF
jgi:hypothetical protein